MSQQKERKILLIELENQAGALARVVGLFAQRNYNIDTLTVAPTHLNHLSSVTITTYATEQYANQIIQQVNKLIEVYSVTNLTQHAYIEREVLLITVRIDSSDTRSRIKDLSDIFRGQIVNVTPTSYTLQVVGTSDKIISFIKSVEKETVLSITRSGLSGIKRPEDS